MAIEKYVAGSLSDSEKIDLMNTLDKRKIDLSTKLSDPESQQMIREADIEYCINFMTNTAQQWSDAEPEVKIRFQSMMFPEGLVYDSINHKFGTSKISPLYRYVGNKKRLRKSFEIFLGTTLLR